MSSALSEQLERLQLDNIPGLAPKAAQYFDQICKQIPAQRNNVLMLSRQTIAIQLACESLSVEFNELAGSAQSAVALRTYQTCVQSVRVALGLNKKLTLEELDVQFNPPPGILEYTRRTLSEFKSAFIATLPMAIGRTIDLEDSVYVAAAFHLVSTRFKRRIASKQKLIAAAMIKPNIFAGALKKIEEFSKVTLAEIDAGRAELGSTPSRKRVRNTNGGSANDESDASSPLTTPTKAPPDEVGTVVHKRIKHVVDSTRAASEPRPRRSSSLRVNVLRRTQVTPSALRPSPSPQETPTKRRATRSSATKSLMPKAPTPTKTTTKKPTTQKLGRKAASGTNKKTPAKRPRIGIASMIQDRDYTTLPLYKDYQLWRSQMLESL
ncbi:Origin of replication complex subunit 6 [Coemansia sp. RSA 1813]|nr:Origin of replication complex subunit 6 [Coemansia sp. RSA 1646]KAJ1770558.1 Origin of replication complex subunit 6 [Coemansia sp. RSA 1843]KAJ2092979.1 Origin of replication complex subunit 6 [Coemansia sp. RSA 986]KAJ2216300.1 Origin of replication complex subunit 6 [Coemansia sp. RSA 487]KAJ2570527.1 Origin of replication complex subunit 6 [Coemansia sp. RSA 1813]